MADNNKMPTTANLIEPVVTQKDFENEEGSPPSKDYRTGNSINSFHHDSEYDTASDLEGGDDDEYDDDDDESLAGDVDEDESENGSIVFDMERQRGDGQEQADYAKKVDEDRSNPQYIPKKGTFYEHDDRTADEPNAESKSDDIGENETTKSSTPTISTSSKTMKKWQQASAVDRWSHDRYDENEQAPKSRSELVSAYGYDIRNEDGPPRARRRRRYGRGPSKYSRNWEDESAYVKSNTGTPQRKPRPEDFPALGDRDKKVKKSRSFRDEKENRYDKLNDRSSTSHRSSIGNSSHRDGRIERRNSGKSFKPGGRHTIEFKNQNRSRLVNDISNNRISSGSRPVEKDEIRNAVDDVKLQVETLSFTNTKLVPVQNNDRYNGHENIQTNHLSGHRDIKERVINCNGNTMTNRQAPQTSQIASRLQVQNRNDPSHVGSVQMHSLVNQNQQEIQQQQQQLQSGTEAGRTKRYSSLRQRSQNEVGVSQTTQIEPHALPQLQMHENQIQPQQQQQQPSQPQHVLIQDQHLIQANLMQLYHTQDNIQAQIQGVSIQNLPNAHQAKPQYQNVSVPQQYQTATTGTPAYYSPTNEYTATTNPAPPTAQYNQAQPTAYIQPQQSAPPPQLSFNPQTQTPAPPPPQQLPAPINYVQTQPAPTGTSSYPSFPSYPNYNTVGGTTYFVPQQQPAPRPVALPQRRPTNAIPILAPPTDKNKSSRAQEDELKNSLSSAPIGSAENIDHILDNMFVQRPPYQPPRKSSSPATESVGTSTSTGNQSEEKLATSAQNPVKEIDENRLEESVKNLTLSDESSLTKSDQTQLQQPSAVVVVHPQQLDVANETG